MTNLLHPGPSALEVCPFCPTYQICSHSSLEQLRGAGQGSAGVEILPSLHPDVASPSKLNPSDRQDFSSPGHSCRGLDSLSATCVSSWPPSCSPLAPHWADPVCVWDSAAVSLPGTAVSSSPRPERALPDHLQLPFFRWLNPIPCTKG